MIVSQESRFKVKKLELQDYFLTILRVIVGMQLTIIYFSMHKLWNYAFTMRQLIRHPFIYCLLHRLKMKWQCMTLAIRLDQYTYPMKPVTCRSYHNSQKVVCCIVLLVLGAT